jgi:hypothetical protein
MKPWRSGLLALGVAALVVGQAAADRTPSVRERGQKSNGARTDITVPYLNNGGDAFKGRSVAPRIYSSPVVDEPKDPGAKPVFNLIFYGSKQNFGDKSNGAGERPANTLRPQKP